MLFNADKKSACIPSSSLSRVYISEGKGLSNKLNRVNIFLNLSPVPPLSTNKEANLCKCIGPENPVLILSPTEVSLTIIVFSNCMCLWVTGISGFSSLLLSQYSFQCQRREQAPEWWFIRDTSALW